jgi:hypothetical protein
MPSHEAEVKPLFRERDRGAMHAWIADGAPA